MDLYVCYGTFPMGPHRHPCHVAHKALLDAGYEPDVKKVYGFGPLPKWMNPRRREVRKITGGSQWVPVLVSDDGELLGKSSDEIIAWAEANPKQG